MDTLSNILRDEDRRTMRRWFALAVGALILAGLFSLGLIIGRMPPFSGWVDDPMLFKRFLVVHVDLALVVWFYAFLAGLYYLIPSKASAPPAWTTVGLSTVGVVLMVLSAGVESAQPILANYVPVVDHPFFIIGLVLFGVGVLRAVLNGRLLMSNERTEDFDRATDDESSNTDIHLPQAVIPGLRAAAIALAAAALSFFAAWLATPKTLEPGAYYELVFWGGGHVLQVACETAMVTVWLVLLTSLLGRPIVERSKAAFLFALLVTPHLAAPLLTLEGTQTPLYHVGSTFLMRWAIFPVVLVILGFCVRALYRAWRDGEIDRSVWKDPRFVGFAASAALTLTGFVLGAMIRGSNTMIPAHYHAAIGAVTVAFMTIGLLLLEPLGLPLKRPKLKKLATIQPALFGFGQLVFAIGFGFAGAHGMGRKLYGSEQQIRSIWEWLGLATMGLGGLVAIAGGLLFLGLIVAAVVPRLRSPDIRPPAPGEFASTHQGT